MWEKKKRKMGFFPSCRWLQESVLKEWGKPTRKEESWPVGSRKATPNSRKVGNGNRKAVSRKTGKTEQGKNRLRVESVFLKGGTGPISLCGSEVTRRSYGGQPTGVKERGRGGRGGERSSYERRVAGKPGTRGQYFHYITLREEESTNCQGPVPYLFLS